MTLPFEFPHSEHDHIHNHWNDLWGHIKNKSQSSEAISPPIYHNSLKGPEWLLNLDLEVDPSQIKDGNIASLLSPFPQFLCSNICVGHICVYKVIQFSVVHDWPHFPLIFLHYCHQRNQSTRRPQLLLGVWHKPVIRYPELQFIFVSTPDMLWNRVLCYFIFQWCGHLATHPLPCCSLYAPVLIENCAEVRFVYCNGGSSPHLSRLYGLSPASQLCRLLAGGWALTRFGVQLIPPQLPGVCHWFSAPLCWYPDW